MQFDVFGKKFSVSFFYETVSQEIKYDGKIQKFDCKQTSCKIDKFEDSELTLSEQWKNVGKAHTVCSPFDQFVKDVGRKEALKRALAACGFNRQHRTKIWQEYRNRSKKSGMVETL